MEVYVKGTEDGSVLNVESQFNFPFDSVHGLGKTREELLLDGYFVEFVSPPEEIKGKRIAKCVDLNSMEMFYTYVDRPKTQEEMIEDMYTLNKTSDQKYKELDLSTATLEEVKQTKMSQLNEACSFAIVSGFDYNVNDVSYRFSCSLPAQANFTGTQIRFDKGKITEAEWTVVNNSSGSEERIILDQVTFETIADVLADHIDRNIKRLRNTLQPQVESATTNAEVDSINW